MSQALAVGLMSGTSVDGIDAALVAIPEGEPSRVKLLQFLTVPYPPATRDFQYEVELVAAIGVGGLGALGTVIGPPLIKYLPTSNSQFPTPNVRPGLANPEFGVRNELGTEIWEGNWGLGAPGRALLFRPGRTAGPKNRTRPTAVAAA